MPKTRLAPVVLFVYNRPEHTNRLLQSLNRLDEVTDTKCYIFSDQAKNEKAQEQVNAVRNLIDTFVAEESHFAEVEVVKAAENRGLAASIIAGVTNVINQHGRAIVLEDDLVVSEDFLRYMNGALDYYEDDENIWAISGYTFPLKAFENYPHDVYMSGRGCSWGWATWKDRWNTVDWEVKDYSSIKFNPIKRHSFATWGKDLPEMLDAYMYGEIHSWAIRWCYEAFKQEKLTVYPVYSRVVNVGTDGSGTNFQSSETRYDTSLISQERCCCFEKCCVNKRIQREFAAKYLYPYEYIKLKVRWLLIRSGLLKSKSKNI